MEPSDVGDETQPVLGAPEESVAVWRTIGHALNICYGNPRRILLPAALIWLPILASSLLYMASHPHSVYIRQHLNPGVNTRQIILIFTSVVLGIYYMATLPVLTAHVLDGRPMSWPGAFSWVRKRSLFWAVVLVVLLSGLATFIGFLLLVVPGFVFGTWFMLAIPARVLGDFPGRRALSESRRLIRPVFSKGALLFFCLMFLPGQVIGLANSLIWGLNATSPGRVIPPAAVAYLFSTLWSPVVGVALALLYVERSGGLAALREDLFA